jgi:hypothetical protein
MPDVTCLHIGTVTTGKHSTRCQCDERVRIGSRRVRLHICPECCVTRSCNDSPHRHATEHVRTSAQTVIASPKLKKRWLGCYPDDACAEY